MELTGKRICCFCERWESGGIESFLYNVLMHTDLDGMEIDIVAARLCESVFTDALKERGVRFVELSGKLRSPENNLLFRRLVRERRYDAVHFNLFQGLALYYAVIARQEGVAARIVHCHGAGLRSSRTKQLKLLLHRLGSRLLLSSATDLWACSRQAAQFLFAGEADSARIIPNGIETERFRFSEEARKTVRAALGLTDQTVIGTVGRMSREKNQTFLLDVFAAFAPRCPDSRLLLVGAGEEEQALRRQAETLGIADRVIFYGTTSDVAGVLAAMDVFVFPSLAEGLGNACVEAQASGLPVLCSEHIPPEARLTPLVHTAELGRGPRSWAEELSVCLRETGDRSDGAALIRAAGFDISDAARLVTAAYMEEQNERSENIGDRAGI